MIKAADALVKSALLEERSRLVTPSSPHQITGNEGGRCDRSFL
ncbi:MULTISPECIES: hypothetical protein [unclassified Microcoleus]